MQIKSNEIAQVLKQQIENYSSKGGVEETGEVILVGDGIARISGLDKVMNGELLIFPNDVTGMALNLEEDNVGAVLFT